MGEWEMNRSLMAIMLAALMIAPVLPVAAITANAAVPDVGVVLYTDVATPNSLVNFYVNLTYLRTALGWVGSEIAIYISGDGTAVLSPNDKKVVDFFYVAEVNYVAGNIRLPSAAELRDLVGNYDPNTGTGYLYIKVTDGNSVAVSTRLLVVFNAANFTTIKGTRLADPYGPLSTTNTFCFKVNLTTINQKLAIDNKDINFSKGEYNISVLFNYGAGLNLIAFKAKAANNTLSNITSDVFNIDTNGTFAITNTTTGQTLFRFNGTLKDFALPIESVAETPENISGIKVNYGEFKIIFNIIDLNESAFLDKAILINEGIPGEAPVTNIYFYKMPLSFGYDVEIKIFPSVALVNVTQNTSTPANTVNPNDIVYLQLRHFPANAPIIVCLFRLDQGQYVKLVGIDTGINTTANGSQIVPVQLPESTYGGYPYAFVAKVAGVRGIPAINTTTNTIVNLPIYPYLEAYAFNELGKPRFPAGGATSWGDYLLVKGHGFLKEPVNIVAISANTLAEVFDLIELAGLTGTNVTVLENGTFIEIVKIPVDVQNETFLVLGKGETPSDSGVSVASFVFKPGQPTVEKVYVNPVPVIVNATYGYIKLGLSPAYPYPAVWEPEENRKFTIEVIGLPAADYKKVNINITDGAVVNIILDNLVNLTPTNGYLLVEGVQVPVIPLGNYNITVYNATNPGIKVETAFPMVNITPTAAFIDPLTKQYTKKVEVMALMDLNVTGYGWPANVYMAWDIAEFAALGFKNFDIVKKVGENDYVAVQTDANGYFTGTVRASLYIGSTGIYHIIIHPKDQYDINDTLTLVIGKAPQLIVNVEAAKTKVVGDKVDIWILVQFSNGELATLDQMKYVKVFVYAMENGQKVEIVDGAEAEFIQPGLWYFTFTIDPEYKGADLVVLVEANGSYLPYLPYQGAFDIATLTVSGGLEDEILAAKNAAEQAVQLAQQLQQQVNDVANAVSQVSQKVDEVSGKVDNVANAVAAASDKLDQLQAGLNDLQNAIGQLSAKLDQLQNNVQQTLDQFKQDVAQKAGEASSTAKTWGIVNLVITLIVLAAVAGLFLRKTP